MVRTFRPHMAYNPRFQFPDAGPNFLEVRTKRSFVLAALLFIPWLSRAADVPARPVPNGRVLTMGPLEADFAALEASIPGFAGWYFDADSNVVVSLKDGGRSEEAFARIAPLAEERVRRGGRGANAPVRIAYESRPARYSFLELAAFRDAVQRDFPGGIHSVDVDEVRNVLALGVATATDVGRIRAYVAKLGIPADAVSVEVEPLAESRVYLWERHRPVRGGSRIAFLTRDGYRGECTVGINGIYNGTSNNAGFLTASHCTTYSWWHTSNRVGQPSHRVADEIAEEMVDPYVFTNAQNPNCPVTTPLENGWENITGCRWSDAAFYRYLDSVRATAWGGPTIHTTTYVNYNGFGSTIINGNLPVTADAPYPVVGTFVNKMGATSGWTNGAVLENGWRGATRATCINMTGAGNHPDDRLTLLLCQDTSDLWLEAGDSGAPVYTMYTDHVEWIGIVWGESKFARKTYHSPAWNVRADFPGFSY